jgi:hypothetical protein
MKLSEEVKQVHDLVDASVYKGETKEPAPQRPGLLSSILKYSPETVEVATGEVGKNLRLFAESADLDHPDLPQAIDGRLDNSEFAHMAMELLDLADHSRARGHNHVPPHYPKILARTEDYSFITLRVSDPDKNTCLVLRFIKDPEKRAQMRLRRSPQDMSLYTFYAKKKDTWESIFDTFSGFVRGVNPHGENVEVLTKRIAHFESLGLDANAKKMYDRIVLIDAAKSEQYYGFNRCPIGIAALMLAKVHNFKMTNRLGDSMTKESRLRLPQTRFTPELNGLINAIAGVDYSPRLYVAPAIKSIPERMKKLMNHLDNFPEAGGKAIFDHFSILMPSLARHDESITGAASPTKNQNQELDYKLIASGGYTPVLMGECDGRQYFLDYWTS